MAVNLTAQEVGRQLGISAEDVNKLVKQEVLRPTQTKNGVYLFDQADIRRITSNRDPTLSEEAAQVGIQIQQEVVYSVSSLQRLRRKLAVAGSLGAVGFFAAIILVAALFKLYPGKLSNFFGYYYQFNVGQQAVYKESIRHTNVLGASTENPDTASSNISMLASLTKPIAAASLLLIKATDGKQYTQIEQKPSGALSQIGTTGASGSRGQPGSSGSNGQAGAPGTNGGDGANGSDGAAGLSVADVTTTAGDIIIRNSSNITSRLGAGSNGQILTINGGVPAWMNSTGLTAESDTLASVTGRGASTSTALTLSSAANDFTLATLRLNGEVVTDLLGSGLTLSGGALNVTDLSNANLSGSAGITNSNLANSGLSLSGNSGSGSVNLGGGLTFSGSGITAITASGSTLTVATNEADTLASITARGTSTSASLSFSGGLTFSGSVTFSSLANCRTLTTNVSGVLGCGDTTGDGVAFTDTSPAATADNDTTELFNDVTKPKITPTFSGQTILVSIHAKFTGGGASDTDTAVRIVRNIGSAASCSGSTQVGDTFSAFLTNLTDIQSAAGTFLDSPGTTGQVFYTVCSSADSKLGTVPVSNRLDVTLVRVGR